MFIKYLVWIYLPIELGSKAVLIDVAVMPDPVDYNIFIGRDDIHAMNVVVFSLFVVRLVKRKGWFVLVTVK